MKDDFNIGSNFFNSTESLSPDITGIEKSVITRSQWSGLYLKNSKGSKLLIRVSTIYPRDLNCSDVIITIEVHHL